MIRIWLAALIFCYASITAWGADDLTRRVQQRLADIGLDPGPIDGAWGGKTRQALNAYRETHGFPPTRNLTGSSLYLLNRHNPDKGSLPHVGQLQTDPVARRAYLSANEPIKSAHCSNGWALPGLPNKPEPIKLITRRMVPDGKISTKQDWYSPIGEPFAISTMACLAGSDTTCLKVIHHVQAWADAKALQTKIGKRSKQFDQVQWSAGSVLRPMISGYAIARQFVEVPADVDATIIDWLYDRAQHYYLPERRTPRSFKNEDKATNHQVTSALTYALANALVGEKQQFKTAIGQWQEALISMREDGSFPTETRRGAWALSYTGLQLNALFGLHELAQHQGIQLPDEEAIHTAVNYLLDGFGDYSLVYPYAKRNFASGDRDPSVPLTSAFDQYFGWLPYYAAQFPAHENTTNAAGLLLDEAICSQQQIDAGKAIRWRCRELATTGATPPLKLGLLLKDATLGHFNSGHMGACTHADRPNHFAASPSTVPFEPTAWRQPATKASWRAARFANHALTTQVVLPSKSATGIRFSALFETSDRKKKQRVRYAIRGNAGWKPGWVDGLLMMVKKPLNASTASKLKKCGIFGSPLQEQGDQYAAVRFTRIENKYSPDNFECLLTALPKGLRADYRLMIQQFPAIARTMVDDGSIDQVVSKRLREFIEAIASNTAEMN